MRTLTPHTLVFVLFVLSLAVPAGAVPGDDIGGGVVLSPHSGPNGQYAKLSGDGNLTIDLGDGLNPDAVTTYDGVFNVSNTGSEDVRVWISHGATKYVEFRTASSGSIEGSGVVLSSGETATVDVAVDTHGAAPGTRLVDEIEVHATGAGPTSPPTPPGSGGTGSGAGLRSAPSGASEDPPTRTLVGSGTVRIEFDRGVRSGEAVRVERLDGLPRDPPVTGVFPVATRVTVDDTAEGLQTVPAERLRQLGVDTVVTAGETVTLSGRRTRLGSASAIDRRRRTAAVHEITPPPRLEDGWATVWFTVDRGAFDGDPSEARAARLTPEGWHLLETRLVRANATHVVLRARTPGFSTFGVFTEPAVAFRWAFEGQGVVVAEEVAVTYEEAGIYAGTLAVTDARGRSNSTNYRILVNDRPDVRVDVPAAADPGEPVTLRADVTDEYGNTNVTWTFDDGTHLEGATVTRAFDAGERVVTVRVADDLGAETTVERRIQVGRQRTVTRVVEYALGVERRLALVVLAALVVVGIVRWLVDRAGGSRRRRRR